MKIYVGTGKRKTTNYDVVSVFLCLLCSKLLDVFVFKNTPYIGLTLCLLPIILLGIKNGLTFRLTNILKIIFVWDVFNVGWLLFSYNSYYLRVIILQNIVLFFVVFSARCILKEEQLDRASTIISIILIVLGTIDITLRGRMGLTFMLIGLSYFLMYRIKPKWLGAGLLAFVFLSLNARSSILSVLMFYVFYITIKKIKTKKAYISLFIVVAVFTIMIPDIYTMIFKSQYSEAINLWSRATFSKNFFSGRQIIWPQIINLIKKHNIWIGMGGEFVGGEFSNIIETSTHNLFLFLRGQGGFVLLGLYLLFMFMIFISFFQNKEKEAVALAGAFLLMLFIRSSFDLVLLANRFLDSMFMWFSICTGVACNNFYNMNSSEAQKTIYGKDEEVD